MSTVSLSSRKDLHAVLARLCDRRQRVRVTPAVSGDRAATIHTRFLSLADNVLLLDWPNGGIRDIPARDGIVDVYFEYQGQRYAFRTRTAGRSWSGGAGRVRQVAWKLVPPVRVTPRQQRAHFRISVTDLDPIAVTLCPTDQPETSATGQLVDLSASGFRGTAGLDAADVLRKGRTCWAQFSLPGDETPIELIVRIVHSEPRTANVIVVFGCAVCGGDDPQALRAQQARIQRFVAERERAKLRRVSRKGG
jgi:c-di-GMP-binding flagellar brake protein YcgR